MGSAPEGVGAPPVARTHGITFCGAKPCTLTGPPMTSRMCLRARVSAHSRTGPTGVPLASTGTVDPHCPVIATARASPPTIDVISRTHSPTAVHHCTASWVASPSRPICTSTGRWAAARMEPSGSTAATLGPPLPRSRARTQLMSGLGRRGVHGVEDATHDHAQRLVAVRHRTEAVHRATLGWLPAMGYGVVDGFP